MWTLTEVRGRRTHILKAVSQHFAEEIIKNLRYLIV